MTTENTLFSTAHKLSPGYNMLRHKMSNNLKGVKSYKICILTIMELNFKSIKREI